MEEESILHLLFACQFSRSIFQASPIQISIPDCLEPSKIIQNWLEKQDKGVTLNLGACILWNVWKTRNDVVFNDTNPLVHKCIFNALQDFKFFDEKNDVNYTAANQISQNKSNCVCEIPSSPFVKINVDATLDGGRCAAGVVARDSFGIYLGSGTICFDASSQAVTEAKAYKLGLQLAQRLQLSKIIVRGDATAIPMAITGNIQGIPWCMLSIILYTKDRIKDFSEATRFIVVPKCANSISHDLYLFAISNYVNR
ncbi:uncharacterized protein LOC113295067 [Papaver somniferum]|uniref:uncharacterized protein LOC113295067 n=1 Tax=Papaver somniferum TaxID=3469 RepID=UPI000E6FF88D|nr:uncharacterized protein LOC113295067 [Papaver somniferum]